MTEYEEDLSLLPPNTAYKQLEELASVREKDAQTSIFSGTRKALVPIKVGQVDGEDIIIPGRPWFVPYFNHILDGHPNSLGKGARLAGVNPATVAYTRRTNPLFVEYENLCKFMATDEFVEHLEDLGSGRKYSKIRTAVVEGRDREEKMVEYSLDATMAVLRAMRPNDWNPTVKDVGANAPSIIILSPDALTKEEVIKQCGPPVDGPVRKKDY